MAYYTIPLKANQPQQVRAIGRVMLIDSVGDSPGVDVTLFVNDSAQKKIPDRRAGFKYVAEFTQVEFLSPVDCTLAVFLSMNEVDLGYIDGVQVSVQGEVFVNNDPDNPVPVSIADTVIEMTATNVGINNNLTTITDFAPVAIGTVTAPLVSDATQKRLRIRNSHATAMLGVGGAGVTLANAAIQISPGDVWIEDDAPGAAWYAVSDTAGTVVQIQGIK
jgi:hypothetical protein